MKKKRIEDHIWRAKKNKQDRDYRNKIKGNPDFKYKEAERQRLYLSNPENKAKRNKWRREWRKKRGYSRDSFTTKEWLNRILSNYVRRTLGKGGRGSAWKKSVGYDIPQLMQHLEKQFTVGMAWENYGKWHIDHIIPRAVFNYRKVTDIDFKKCWALSNLQPLWAKDNWNKSAKLSKSFQPSLSLSLRGKSCE